MQTLFAGPKVMGGKRTYNYETFAPGTRVKVHAASPMEGSDHDWHGYTGEVISNGHWTLVRMDKKPRHWPSLEVLLCDFNLRRASSLPRPQSGGEA